MSRGILFLTIFLSVIGLVAIADSSYPQAQSIFSDKFYYLKQQSLWAVLGFASLLVGLLLDYRIWKKLGVFIFWGSIFLLVLVLIPGFGSKLLGARRWLNLGYFSFQPSEIVKLSLTLYFARLIESKKKLSSFLIPLAATTGLIMLQPDLGTAVVITVISLIMLFISGLSVFKYLSVLTAGGLAGLFLVLISDYRRDRLTTFLNQAYDPLGKSYHIRQILLALGTGGLFGVGFGNSRQKYLFLPETATDSIFAVIAEEVGFIGASIIILIFLVLIYRIFIVALKSKDQFSKSVVLGIGAWIGIQVILNIGSVVALVPLTGVPLPFFSYGGSSLIMTLFSIGIVLNISRKLKTTK